MSKKTILFVKFFSLSLLLLLLSTFLFQTCSNEESYPSEPTLSEFVYSNPIVYTVDSSPNSVIHDTATGVTLSFPEGGSGDVAISKILSVPSIPMEGNGVRIEYSTDTPIDLVIDTSDGSSAEVLEYGNFTGCFDDEIGNGKRWTAVPRADTDGSKISFMLMMPYDLAKSVAVKPIGSNNFWIARLKPDADLVEQRVATDLQILTFYKQFIATLPASIKSTVDTKGKSRFVRTKYDGGAYYAGFWMRVLGKGVSYEPTVHLGLPPRTQQIAHELGHYLIHLLVGDDVQIKLENQGNLFGGHAVLDVVGRDVLLEDLAYYTEFVLTQLGADGYNLLKPYDMLKGSSPLKNDFPSYEGFAAHLLAQLIRTEPKIRDFESGQFRNIPLVKLSYGQVFEIISKGATGINTLRKNIEDYLGTQSNKLPVICHRLGWRYLAEGKLVDPEGNPIPNASIEPIVIINGVVYKGMEGAATSSADGTFILSGEAFPGNSILRVKLSSNDSTDVPIFIDWDKSTTKTIQLGDLVVNKKRIKSIKVDIFFDGTYEVSDNIGSDIFTYDNSGLVSNSLWHSDVSVQINSNGNTITFIQDLDNELVKANSTTTVTFEDINNPVTIVDFSFNKTYDDKSNRQLIVQSASGSNIPFIFSEKSWNGNYDLDYEGSISQYVTINELIKETVTIVASPADYDKIITKELLNFDSIGEIHIDIEFE